jgi:hypothetical protein
MRSRRQKKFWKEWSGMEDMFLVYAAGAQLLRKNSFHRDDRIHSTKPERKRPLRRYRRRLEIILKQTSMKMTAFCDMAPCGHEIGNEDIDWIYLAQDRVHWLTVVNTVINFRVP